MIAALLPPGEVRLYLARLDGVPPDDTSLSPAERDRAGRFHRAEDAARFVAARAAQRRLLASLLGTAPREVPLVTEGGAPRVAGEPGLRFSFSRSADALLAAVARAIPVGVDLERVRAIDALEVAAPFFAPGELGLLRALPERERRATFFRLWTRKEAYLKALGTGLARPLASFAVTLEGAGLAWDAEDAGAPARWRLEEPRVADGFAAALALPADARAAQVRPWP